MNILFDPWHAHMLNIKDLKLLLHIQQNAHNLKYNMHCIDLG